MTDQQSEHDLISDRHRGVYARLLSSTPDFASVDRRDFLKLLGASIAFAGLTGCRVRQPVEKIIPYVHQPQEIVPGKPLFYATAMSLGGYAMGLLVESHEGRPTKIEGNPAHPSSLGATSVFAQASVLDLYDPDRSQTPLYLGDIRTWGDFLSDFRRELAKQRAKNGTGLRILTETVSSPTLLEQLKKLAEEFPQMKWHQYEPINRDNILEGARVAFGEYAEAIYHFDKANVVLSLDADFLMSEPTGVRYSHDFMTRRRARKDSFQINRLYVAECMPSNTGAIADHRLPVRPSEVQGIARLIAAGLGINTPSNQTSSYGDWIAAVAEDLKANQGASIVVAGARQPPAVHALAHAMNHSLGNVGHTIRYVEPVAGNPTNQVNSLRQLAEDMEAGSVELLVILGGNPVYNAPADLHFAERLSKVPLRVHHSLYYDETSALCHWHINEAHYLESWSDARGFDGTISIVQPLIEPLYSGKTAHEVLAAFTEQPDRSSYDIVKSYWMQVRGQATGNTSRKPREGAPNKPSLGPVPVPTPAASNAPESLSTAQKDFDHWWSETLRKGLIDGSARPEKTLPLNLGTIAASPADATATSGMEIVINPDPTIYDGRFANNGWLQELPKPLTKLTWDNAAFISPRTAERLALNVVPGARGGEHGTNISDVVELTLGGRTLRAPVWIVPGHADDCVTINLGYGRTRAGATGSSTSQNPCGFDAYSLRASGNLWFATGLQIRKTQMSYELACTQAHSVMEGRDLIRSAGIGEYVKNPEFAQREADKADKQISLYPGWKYNAYAWGMSIDTGACIGCNACVVACQAENNIPVVGKQEVLHAREMHWIRIDRYFEGDQQNPDIPFQPVPCQQCENAPCELVCPVEATTHSDEGLNEMTYNRCVGTRYCSNNCPYKVRRFNFFEYGKFDDALVKLQRNPEVTVRSRGVMEKCTYCIQRITAAKIQAEEEGRRVQDGEITPACQQACPAEAIIFGDINDPNSRVARLKAEPTDYGLLADLNTRPRTTYLARIRNPNPDIDRQTRGGT